MNKSKPTKHERARDFTGKYDFEDMGIICECGHRLGVHIAERNKLGERECLNKEVGDGRECDCNTFKRATKQ